MADDGQEMWGGRFARRAGRADARDQRLDPLRQAPVARGYRRLEGACRDARRAGDHLAPTDAAAILDGLDRIAAEYERDGVPEESALEDIHMNVEHRLAELIGAAAGRLHTARSRNDQVATDFRLWVRDAIDEARRGAARAASARWSTRAEEHADTRDARLHPSAGRAAGDARPSSDGLFRDAAAATARASPTRGRG